MTSATGLEYLVDRSFTNSPSSLQAMPAGARPGFVEGYDPGAGLRNFAGMVARAIPFSPMVSPPFTPPGTPTDYGNYAPFQRYTHFGNYFTYPISTVGKLFIDTDGDGVFNAQCSASVVNRNTIATAAHCLHTGGPSGGFFADWAFCPGYTPGGCVRGTWDWTFGAVSVSWVTTAGGNPDRDYACLVTNQPAGLGALGDLTGWLGRAFNWPTRQAEFAWGYPVGPVSGTANFPFPGYHIITVTSTEWYQNDFVADGGTNHVSKYIGSDMTGGSSGGPWWISHRHPNAAFDYGDSDGSALTDPPSFGVLAASGGPYINGVNSHKRCNAGGCPAGSVFTQEMGSPQFLNSADTDEFEDRVGLCFANGGS
jgi:hypothetical protein